MNTFKSAPTVLLILFLGMKGFSQDSISAPTEKKTQSDGSKESSGPGGLRKISTRDHRDWNFNFKIDEKTLEATINSAVESAMRSVDVAIEKIEINIEPIEIDLRGLNIDVNPIEVNIPHIDIDVQPIEIDREDIHIDMDIERHHFDFDDNDEDRDRDTDADDDDDKSFRRDGSQVIIHKHNRVRDNDSADEENEKTKGLKKLN